ncbi:YjcZ family sporulation protein [Paenibacillus sp. PSB04]|nr:YjcZ family sporulation protein [Paenibacillus sp. PSB04]
MAAAPCVPYSNVGVVLVLFILLVIILRAFWC